MVGVVLFFMLAVGLPLYLLSADREADTVADDIKRRDLTQRVQGGDTGRGLTN